MGGDPKAAVRRLTLRYICAAGRPDKKKIAMSHHAPLPPFFDPARSRSEATENGGHSEALTPRPTMSGGKMLGAVSTLMALTPRGRTEEITRLTALAHGFIGLASEDEIVALAKAVAGRDDVGEGLTDRLARSSKRASHTLIRANSLSDETIAYLLETSDLETRVLIAGHHKLMPKHVMMLVADGEPTVLKALLDNQHTDLTDKARRAIVGSAGSVDSDLAPLESKPSLTDGSGADPRRTAEHFASMDGAARRAVVRRLAEDGPKELSLSAAARSLDPTRNDADLQFLTVIEQRDPSKLRDTFASSLDLDPTIVGKLLDEADGDAMVVLAKAAGLSSTAFARMIILSKIGLTGSPRDTFKLVDRFKALPEATADFIVKAMRGEEKAKRSVSPSRQSLRRLTPADVQPVLDRSSRRPDGGAQGFRRAV